MKNPNQSVADRQAEQRRAQLKRHERTKILREQIEEEEAKHAKPQLSRGSARILRKMEKRTLFFSTRLDYMNTQHNKVPVHLEHRNFLNLMQIFPLKSYNQ